MENSVMSSPFLSIIVPVYNAEEYLEICLDSILAQTYEVYELILVDDGSTDTSPQICDNYAKAHNIKVIHKKNGGITSARKAGVAEAVGKYIGFVDADDWIDKSMFEEMVDKAVSTGADIVSCGYIREDRYSSTVFLNQCEEGYYDKERLQTEIYPSFIAYGTDWVNQRIMPPHFVDKIFRKDLLRPILDSADERVVWGEDMITVYPAILSAESIYIIKKAFYHYRKNVSSVSYKKDRKALDLFPLVIKELLKISDEFGGNIEKQIGYCVVYDFPEMLRHVFGLTYHKLYLFPISLFDRGDKIIIYGAGAVGWSYYCQASNLNYFDAVVWTDSNKEKHKGNVIAPKTAFELPYDKVLIAVENEGVSIQINQKLIELYNIPEKKLVWTKPQVIEGAFSYHYD